MMPMSIAEAEAAAVHFPGIHVSTGTKRLPGAGSVGAAGTCISDPTTWAEKIKTPSFVAEHRLIGPRKEGH